METKLIQRRLDEFLVTPSPIPKEAISHRDLILYLLQFGQWSKESALYRALITEIKSRKAKGYDIAWLTWDKFQRQLHNLKRQGLLNQYGVCWRLKLI